MRHIAIDQGRLRRVTVVPTDDALAAWYRSSAAAVRSIANSRVACCWQD
jgi:hypothetical protein